MILRRLVLLFILAAGLNACSTAAVSESPVSYTNPEGERVEALSMTSPRANAASIRLNDGRVLICGGTSNAKVGGVLSSAELYDSNTRRFIPTGAMTVARMGQTITMLRDGRVLITGGARNIGFRSELASAEIYDPSTGTFATTGSMRTPRKGHTATMLRDGRVLIAGGGRGGMPGGYISYDTAELYDPDTRMFAKMRAHMIFDRVGAAAVRLNDGRVLIVGGKSGRIVTSRHVNLASLTPLNSAEIYDPELNSFIRTGDMSAPHYLATATMLGNGQVLVVGGWTIQGFVVVGMRDADLYQPETNRFVRAGRTNVARLENTANLLS